MSAALAAGGVALVVVVIGLIVSHRRRQQKKCTDGDIAAEGGATHGHTDSSDPIVAQPIYADINAAEDTVAAHRVAHIPKASTRESLASVDGRSETHYVMPGSVGEATSDTHYAVGEATSDTHYVLPGSVAEAVSDTHYVLPGSVAETAYDMPDGCDVMEHGSLAANVYENVDTESVYEGMDGGILADYEYAPNVGTDADITRV